MKKCLICVLALLLALGVCLPTLAVAEAKLSITEGLDSDWWNILLLGCDSYTQKSYSRSDSMIILSVNTKTCEVKMTSLMRDTWIKVSGWKHYMKLTEACGHGGPELVIRAINENFGMNISDYALVSMEGIADIIDTLGGVDIEVTEEERKALNKGLFDLSSQSGMEKLEESGMVHLNGNQATAFARIRKIDSDYVRTERQRTVLVALAGKIKANANAATLVSLVSTLSQFVETNLTLSEIGSLGMLGLQLDLNSVEQTRLPADGTFESGTYDGIWCIKPNFKKNRTILYDFIYG